MAEYTEYRVKNSDGVAVKVTEEEYRQLVGTRETAPYAIKVWSKKMTIEEVPEELQEAVQTIVNNRVAWMGTYEDQPVNTKELRDLVQEGAKDS